MRSVLWALVTVGALTVNAAAGQTSIVVNNIYTVAATGSLSENCDSLRDTLSGIVLGLNERALVRLEPGFYDCGTSGVMMRSEIDVEGSGPGITVIYGNVDANTSPSPLGVVELVDFMELRDVLVVNDSTGPLTLPVAIAYQGEAIARLRNVGAVSRTGVNGSYGFYHNGSGHLDTFDASLEGATNSIFISQTGQKAILTYSRLQMPVGGTGTAKCLYSYTGDDELASDCTGPFP